MKKYFFFLFLFMITIPLFSKEETRKSVLICNFVNAGSEESAHFSTILPENIGIEIERTGYYHVKRSRQARLTSTDASSRAHLKKKAAAQSSDYVVSGIYSVDDGKITITSYVYVKDADQMYRVIIPSKKTGVFINQLVDTLSVKISFELQKHLNRMSDPPVIKPYAPGFAYHKKITIHSDIDGARVYYTTDGSTPSRQNGSLYTGPFNVYRSALVHAVAVKDGEAVSEVAERKYEQHARISLLEIKSLYGIMQYIEPETPMGDFGSAQLLSAVPVLYLGGFDGIKTVPFLRDLGIGGWFDFANAPLESEYTYLMRGYSGGLFYKIRFHDNFLAELPVTYGVMKTSIGERSGSHIFSGPITEFDEETDQYLNTGLLFNIRIGHFEIDFGPTFKYIQYSGEPARILALQAGIGFNF